MRLAICLSVVVSTFVPALASRAADELSHPKIGQIGKAATARLEVEVAGGHKFYFAAFCIDSLGVFVSAAHLGAIHIPPDVTLVLNPSLKNERKLAGKVVRLDIDKNLAVIRVDGAKNLPTIELGSVDDLAEAMEVCGFGFPLESNGVTPPAPPDLSVNFGSISSLLRKDGEIKGIKVDATFDFGNTGGPLLDQRGRAVGVVVSAGKRLRLSMAVPISTVASILAKPEVEFKPKAIERSVADKPAPFEAKVDWLLPPKTPVNVQLLLKNDDDKERRFIMDLKQGVYRTAAVPIPSSDESAPVNATIRFKNGTIAGLCADRSITIGGKGVMLSELRSLSWKPDLSGKPGAEAVLADGNTVAGPIAGLDVVEVRLGKESVRLKLTEALDMRIEAVKPASQVDCTVIVRQGGVELARATAPLSIIESVPVPAAPWKNGGDDPFQTGPDKPAASNTGQSNTGHVPVTIKPIDAPPLEQEKVVRPLPGAIDDIVVGGGGRYLIARMAKQQQLCLFDVQQGRLVKQIPLAEPNIRFAAGAQRLVVIYPGAKLLQTWNLATLQRERSVLLPENMASREMSNICMGSASPGPLFFYIPGEKRTLALDIETMKTTQIDWSQWSPTNAYGPLNMRVAPDGSMLVGWGGGWAGSEVAFFKNGKEIGTQNPNGFSALSGGCALPSVDGRFIYAPSIVFNRALSPTQVPGVSGAYLMPAAEPGYFLAMANEASSVRAGVYNDDRRLLFSLSGLDELKGGSSLPWEKRIYYYPRAGLLLTLAAEQDRLILRRVKLVDELEKSGADYLVVLSQPPPAKAGELFSYKLDIHSKKGGVNVSLDSGPDGMSVTSDGRVSWRVPAEVEAPEANIVVTIRDASGQEVFHAFAVQVK